MNHSRILITSAAGKTGILRLLLPRPIALHRMQREREHVLLQSPSYATESDEWIRTHRAPGSYGVGGIDSHHAASTRSQGPNDHGNGARMSREVRRA